MSLLAERTTERVSKALPYKLAEGASDVPSGGVVGRGVNVKSGAPFLIFQDGRTQQALPLAAVAQAIYAGVITPAEVAELHAAAEKAEKEAGGK